MASLQTALWWILDTHQSVHLAAERVLDREVGTAPVAGLAEPKALHAVAEADVVASLVAGQQRAVPAAGENGEPRARLGDAGQALAVLA